MHSVWEASMLDMKPNAVRIRKNRIAPYLDKVCVRETGARLPESDARVRPFLEGILHVMGNVAGCYQLSGLPSGGTLVVLVDSLDCDEQKGSIPILGNPQEPARFAVILN